MEKDRLFYYTLVFLFSNKQVTLRYVKDIKFVTYWGQNKANVALDTIELSLASLCSRESPYSTIVVGYVSRYVDNRNKDFLPGMGFSIHCTKLQSSFLYCPNIGRDISFCQQRAKKILIGIGGPGSPAKFENAQAAVRFAKLVWNLFLGGNDKYYMRPFGSVIMNGINFFMQNNDPLHSNVFIQSLNQLRSMDQSRSYLITISPSCMFPNPFYGPDGDKILDISKKFIDEIYVRFTESTCCMRGSSGSLESLIRWKNFIINANHSKLYVGVPAALEATQYPECYRKPFELANIYKSLKTTPNFEGFLIIDNSFDLQNLNDGFLFSKPLLSLLRNTQHQFQRNKAKPLVKKAEYPVQNYKFPASTKVTHPGNNLAQFNVATQTEDTNQFKIPMKNKVFYNVPLPEAATVPQPTQTATVPQPTQTATMPQPITDFQSLSDSESGTLPETVTVLNPVALSETVTTVPEPVAVPNPVTELHGVSELEQVSSSGAGTVPETTPILDMPLASDQVILSEPVSPPDQSFKSIVQTKLKTPAKMNMKPVRLIFESTEVNPAISAVTSTILYPTDSNAPSTVNPNDNFNEAGYINLDDETYEIDEDNDYNDQVVPLQNSTPNYPETEINEEPVEDDDDEEEHFDDDKKPTIFDQASIKHPTRKPSCLSSCQSIKKDNTTEGLFSSNQSFYRNFSTKSIHSLNKRKSLKEVGEKQSYRSSFRVHHFKTKNSKIKLGYKTESRRAHNFQTMLSKKINKLFNLATSKNQVFDLNELCLNKQKCLKSEYGISPIRGKSNNVIFDSPIKKRVISSNLISGPKIHIRINIPRTNAKFAENTDNYGITIKTNCPRGYCKEYFTPEYYYLKEESDNSEFLKLAKNKFLYPKNESMGKYFEKMILKYAENSSNEEKLKKVKDFLSITNSSKRSNSYQKKYSNNQIELKKNCQLLQEYLQKQLNCFSEESFSEENLNGKPSAKLLAVDKLGTENESEKQNKNKTGVRLIQIKNVVSDKSEFKNIMNKVKKDIDSANNLIMKVKKKIISRKK